MMQSTLQKGLVIILAAAFASACVPSQTKDNSNNNGGNIYDALTNDNVQYRDEADNAAARRNTEGNEEYVTDKIKELRTLYFKRKFVDAAELAEELLRADSQLAQAYYWLARIRMDEGDFNQAHELANKGLVVVYDKGLRRELERVSGITQMGAQ